MEFHERLEEARQSAGKSQKELADFLRVSQPTVSDWFSGKMMPKPKRLPQIADFLGVNDAWLQRGVGTRDRSLEDALPPAANDDIPIMGVAAGSASGAFLLGPAPIDYAPRLRGIGITRNVYALWVVGDSMDPAYRQGDLVYIDRDRPPAIGDFVIVQVQTHSAAQTEAYIKRLIKRTDDFIETEQYNPAAKMKFAAKTVRRIEKVLTTRDLAGV